MPFHVYIVTCEATGMKQVALRQETMREFMGRVASDAASGHGNSNFIRSVRVHGIDAHTIEPHGEYPTRYDARVAKKSLILELGDKAMNHFLPPI
jgi:hypothetical protein